MQGHGRENKILQGTLKAHLFRSFFGDFRHRNDIMGREHFGTMSFLPAAVTKCLSWKKTKFLMSRNYYFNFFNIPFPVSYVRRILWNMAVEPFTPSCREPLTALNVFMQKTRSGLSGRLYIGHSREKRHAVKPWMGDRFIIWKCTLRI